jgi:hypothetical protein
MIDMDKFLDYISAYHFLNYIIPGTLFLVLVDVLDIYDLPLNNVLLMLFGGYCSGMVLSRIGSLLLENYLRKWKFIVFASHSDYKDAESKDPKVGILSTENNMYRTFLTTYFSLLLLFGLNLIPCVNGFMHTPWMALIIIAFLTLLFLFAYRKQTSYVRKSVENVVKKMKEK